MSKRCRLICDTERGIHECELELADTATIATVLEAARLRLGDGLVDWDSVPVGVFGQIRDRDFVPADGDRIEVYRSLLIDPRQSRRARAARGTSQRGR